MEIMESQTTDNINLEIIKRQDFLIYQDDNGVSRVNVRFEGDDVWLTAEQLTELFDASQQNISHHINQIYAEGELDENRTHKKYLLVRNEGKRSVKRRKLHKLSYRIKKPKFLPPSLMPSLA